MFSLIKLKCPHHCVTVYFVSEDFKLKILLFALKEIEINC